MQRSTVMEFCINVCLLLFLENAFLRVHICREEAGSLDFTQNSSFPAKRHQRHAKVNFGDDGKHEISNRLQSFAVNAMLKGPNCEGLSPIFSEDRKPVVLSGRASRERMNGLISKYLVFLEFPPKDLNAMRKTLTTVGIESTTFGLDHRCSTD